MWKVSACFCFLGPRQPGNSSLGLSFLFCEWAQVMLCLFLVMMSRKGYAHVLCMWLSVSLEEPLLGQILAVVTDPSSWVRGYWGDGVCFSTRQQVLLGVVQAGAEAACWVLRCWVLVSSLGECGGMGGLLAPPALPACSPALSISSCEMGGETGLTVRGVPTCILQEAGMWGEEGPLGGCQGLVPAGPPPLPTPCPAFVGISLS